MKGLEGKVAIVTGGPPESGGACRRFVAEGCRVSIGDINASAAQALAEELGAAAIVIPSMPATWRRWPISSRAREAFWTSGFSLQQRGPDVERDHPSRHQSGGHRFRVVGSRHASDLRGYLQAASMRCSHAQGGKGSIVLTASGSGLLGDISNIAYGASKAAIMSVGRYIAAQYGKQGIRCNSINPGLIRTEGGMKTCMAMVDIMARNTLTRGSATRRHRRDGGLSVFRGCRIHHWQAICVDGAC